MTRRRHSPGSGQAGFTLVEMLITLVLLLVGLMIASELLMEAAQLLATTSGEAADTPVPLAIARLRADVQGADSALPVFSEEGDLVALVFAGRDASGRERQVVYSKSEDILLRRVVRTDGSLPGSPEIVWKQVLGWRSEINGGLVDLRIDYMRRAVPRSPLPGLPVDRGPRAELRTERMFFLTRGSGLGASW